VAQIKLEVRNIAHMSRKISSLTASRGQLWRAVLLAGVVAAGFAGRLYEGPGQDWLQYSAGGFWYALFWCLLVSLLVARARPWIVAVAVCGVTCALEFLQLWHPSWLTVVRRTWPGQVLLGTSFDWGDFPYYAFGCAVGWTLLKATARARSES